MEFEFDDCYNLYPSFTYGFDSVNNSVQSEDKASAARRPTDCTHSKDCLISDATVKEGSSLDDVAVSNRNAGCSTVYSKNVDDTYAMDSFTGDVSVTEDSCADEGAPVDRHNGVGAGNFQEVRSANEIVIDSMYAMDVTPPKGSSVDEHAGISKFVAGAVGRTWESNSVHERSSLCEDPGSYLSETVSEIADNKDAKYKADSFCEGIIPAIATGDSSLHQRLPGRRDGIGDMQDDNSQHDPANETAASNSLSCMQKNVTKHESFGRVTASGSAMHNSKDESSFHADSRTMQDNSLQSATSKEQLRSGIGSEDRKRHFYGSDSNERLRPSEDLFVSAKAGVRRCEYEKLEAAYRAGDDMRFFTPWFREMLSDADDDAFCAACAAVAQHYRSAAGRGNQGASLVWLHALAQRLLDHSQTSAEELAAAKTVTAAVCCQRSGVVKEIEDLLASDDVATTPAALLLLRLCAMGEALSSKDIGMLLRKTVEGGVSPISRLDVSRQEQGFQELHALLRYLPELEAELPACIRETSAFGKQGSQSSHLKASPAPPKKSRTGTDWRSLQILGDTSVRSWRDRLQCLEEIDGTDSDNMHGQMLLPQLVIQTGDDRPVVAAAALRAIARIAHRLESLGDHLSSRLAAAIRTRMREGRAKCMEAASSCIVALMQHKVLTSTALVNFLSQALGCTRDAARTALPAILKDVSVHVGDAQAHGVPSCLDALIQASPGCSGRRTPVSHSGSVPCTPNHEFLSASPPVLSMTSVTSPVDHVAQTPWVSSFPTLLLPQTEERSRVGLSPSSGKAGRARAGPLLAEGTSTSSMTPARYGNMLKTPESGTSSRQKDRSPGSPLGPRNLHLQSAEKPSMLRESPLACTPPPRRRSHACLMNSPTPLPPALSPCPEDRAEYGSTCGNSQPAQSLTTCGVLQCEGPKSCLSSLAGPHLHGDSKLLSPCHVSLTGSSVSAESRHGTPRPQKMSATQPFASDTAGLKGDAGNGASPNPRCVALRSKSSPVPRATAGDNASLIPRAAALDNPSPIPRDKVSPMFKNPAVVAWSPSPNEGVQSFLISPPGKPPAVRVRGLCAQAAAGLQALEEGGDPAAWHEALRLLAAWEPGEDGVRGEAAAEAVVGLLLDTASRLRLDARPEIWRALGELRNAPWLTTTAMLDLSVKHCLSFTEPEVVSAYLVARIAEHRLSAESCLDFCLEQLTKVEVGQSTTRLAVLFKALVEALQQGERPILTGDLTLPSLPAAVEHATWQLKGTSALTPLRTGLEPLLHHLSPACAPGSCWDQLRSLLGAKVPAQLGADAHSSEASMPNARGFNPSSKADLRVPLSRWKDFESQGAVGDEAIELAAALGRLFKLTQELESGKVDTASTLMRVVQELSRPQFIQPIRSFLRRLLTRQRQRNAGKENTPPAPPRGWPKSAVEDFLEDDYATIRELCSDEKLVGVFPHSLLTYLKRLLRVPTAAGTCKAAIECLSALVGACGPLLLRVVLSHFASILLQLASSRSPSQKPARALLTQLAALNEDATSYSVGSLRWLRQVWHAIAHAVGPRGESAGDPMMRCEMFRWLAHDALSQMPPNSLRTAEVRDMLGVLVPSLHDRNASTRRAAQEALRALATTREGGEDQLRKDIRELPDLATGARAAAISYLDAAEQHTPSVHRTRTPTSTPARCRTAPSSVRMSTPQARRNPSLGPGRARAEDNLTPDIHRRSYPSDKTPSAAKTEKKLFANSPDVFGISSGNVDASCKQSWSSPMQVVNSLGSHASDDRTPSPRLYAPSVDARTPGLQSSVGWKIRDESLAEVRELEMELASLQAEVANFDSGTTCSELMRRTSVLSRHLETFFLHCDGPAINTVVPAIFAFLAQLVRRAAEIDLEMQEASDGNAPISESGFWPLHVALSLVRTARATFTVPAMRSLNSPAAAAAFRASLRALAQLQQLANGTSEVKESEPRRSAAQLFMELPLALAHLIDGLDTSTQLTAWVRVAGEVLDDECCMESISGDYTTARRWALRFCARCLDRCVQGLHTTDRQCSLAWDVLSELLRYHERRCPESATDPNWAADCDTWCQALQRAAMEVSRRYPAETQEFLQLASCAGGKLPAGIAHLLPSR